LGDWLRRLFTSTSPRSSYLPASEIVGKPTLGLPDWTRILSPLAALALAAVACCGWHVGVQRYQSTGS
jgi:ABC-2 type transport system permease protein